jgi:hypothetical protein
LDESNDGTPTPFRGALLVDDAVVDACAVPVAVCIGEVEDEVDT